MGKTKKSKDTITKPKRAKQQKCTLKRPTGMDKVTFRYLAKWFAYADRLNKD